MWICEVSGPNIVGEVMNEAGHRICDQFPPSLEKMCLNVYGYFRGRSSMLMIWDDYVDEFAPKYHDNYIDFRNKSL